MKLFYIYILDFFLICIPFENIPFTSCHVDTTGSERKSLQKEFSSQTVVSRTIVPIGGFLLFSSSGDNSVCGMFSSLLVVTRTNRRWISQRGHGQHLNPDRGSNSSLSHQNQKQFFFSFRCHFLSCWKSWNIYVGVIGTLLCLSGPSDWRAQAPWTVPSGKPTLIGGYPSQSMDSSLMIGS